MKFKFSGKYKVLKECVPGELVQFSFGDMAALGIVLQAVDGEDSFVLGMLRCRGEYPSLIWIVVNSESKCVAYGNDWLLEPEATALTYPGDCSFESKWGVLHIDRGGVYVVFGSDPNAGINLRPTWINLEKIGVPGRPGSKSIPCLKWKIWVSEEERSDPRCEPIFAFPLA